MNYNEAMEIRASLKTFWKNYKVILTLTGQYNENNNANCNWHHYFNNNGSVADYSYIPELTNARLIAFVTKDTGSKLYPEDEMQDDFIFILNYKN